MNFIPCRLEEADGIAARAHLRRARAAGAGGARRALSVRSRQGGLTFGLRPEHITEAKPNGDEPLANLDAVLDVIEPMGMETMVFFNIAGIDVCARVEPRSRCARGTPMRLAANLNHMHLIEDESGRVI